MAYTRDDALYPSLHCLASYSELRISAVPSQILHVRQQRDMYQRCAMPNEQRKVRSHRNQLATKIESSFVTL